MVGFDAKNKDSLDTKFICSKCSLILRAPMQLTECGHRLCQSCVDHEAETITTCPVCQMQTQRTQIVLDRGFRYEMQSIRIQCAHCQWKGSLQDYQDHLYESPLHRECEYCAEQCDSIDALNKHKISECPKTPINCGLKDFGCKEKIIRDNMSAHYLSQQHQESILSVISRIAPSSMNTQNSRAYPSKGKLGVQESRKLLNERQFNETNTDQHATTTSEKIDNSRGISRDGAFVWKIEKFRKKMDDAQSERQTSIYSPPFHSSPNGYKMRARLYLHGDGNARRTHMSLFFVLMRSEYDPILRFPFTFNVTFCLYDQTAAQRHIIDSFRPDIRSNSFQRPRSEMNIASGIPKFCPLTVIQQDGNPYVRDDTMFIKVMVDFGDMPNTILPYALSLDLELPAHVQHAMVQAEAEKQTKQKSS